MNTRLLYFGPQWSGSTSVQRLEAFQRLEGVSAIGIDNGAIIGGGTSLWRRLRWRLRLPVDACDENRRLVQAAAAHRPDVIVVDNSKVIRSATMRRLRELGAKSLVYYSPDDITAPHNLSLPLKWTLSEWDVVCTTKSFNIPELRALGVRRPYLVGKAYDPELHKPALHQEIGAEFERFDAVFVGSYERERCASINALARAGISVAVYGSDKGGWKPEYLHSSIELRESVFAADYTRAWHVGKVALCFLRKINRDRITQRTMEVAAMGRPMVAERTDEHDQHFRDGAEYLGFSTDEELVSQVRCLIADDMRRLRVAAAGRERCFTSGYSTNERASQMIMAFAESTPEPDEGSAT